MQLLIAFLAGALLIGIWALWKINQLKLENIRLQERKNALDQKQAEQEKFFNTLQQQAKDSFKQLATDSLKEQKAELVNQNKEMVSPLKETLDKFTKQVGELRTESTARHGLLQNAIERTLQLNENLSQEAQNLTEALKSPKRQGTWGEIILEDVLTAAGLRKGIEFDTQVSFTTQENQRKQPDFIIHLPGKRDLIIDSKMSFTAYMQWQAATTEEDKQKYLKEHVTSIEKHIKELAQQDYTALLPHEKLDFTFMFIPIEYAYFIAVQAKPELNELARKNHIAIVTASNLFSVLQVADNLWRQERAGQLTEKIFKTAQEMLERTGRFAQRMEEIHTRINQLDKSYIEADKALRGKQGIISSAKQLEDLRLKSSKQLPELLEDEKASLPQDNNA
ncbi:MAG: DNA recombination protein RmuC [Elusimicrobiaceae bacterium]|nr:DNA recombination protein RmuC [Elusimicrobiaceae bacterium]